MKEWPDSERVTWPKPRADPPEEPSHPWARELRDKDVLPPWHERERDRDTES